MKAQYIRLMDALHRASLFVAGVCLVVITLIIPWGVFTRFVLNSASSWPEPLAVLLMIVLSFFSAIVCYREYLHIGVGVLPAVLGDTGKAVLGWLIEACMMATNVFMVWFGLKLVHTTWNQGVAEFPWLSVGITYLPVTIAGAVTALFIVERLLTREFFREQSIETTSTVATE
jgi:TRAP-type C4-dicarboxylate transport system permease small subunit